MRKTIEIIKCDICKNEIPEDKERTLDVPVIFHTDQTEGRGTEPYLTVIKMDLCKECAMKITRVHGWGAQGYNDYDLRDF